jgi:hypothetical protein
MNRIEPFERGKDTFLIETYCGDVYILAMHNLPTESTTLKEYTKWRGEYTPGAICLTKPWVPQLMNHSSIKRYHSIGQYAEIKGTSFRDILSRLISLPMDTDYDQFVSYLKKLHVENVKREAQEVYAS